jgi:hypothetical protein
MCFLLNHGETAAVTALVLEHPEPAGPGALRQRLRTRHAEKWADRPLVAAIPAAATRRDA